MLNLNAYFPGLLSALQSFSHPLTQLPLIIGLPCETYSQVSPGKLFLSPFQAAYIEISRLGNSKLEKAPPYQGTHLYTWVKRGKQYGQANKLEQTPPYQGTHLYTWVKRSNQYGQSALLKEPLALGARGFYLHLRSLGVHCDAASLPTSNNVGRIHH